MRAHLEDHAGFQRATLHVAVACSALAAAGVLAGSESLRPAVAVLGAAVATIALALGHVRLVIDPLREALARAADGTDGETRARLARVATAHDRLARSAERAVGSTAADARLLARTSAQAVGALAGLLDRRAGLARALGDARPAEAAREADALDAQSTAATDHVLRETHARAATAARERGARAAALEALVARLDARVVAAMMELEAAALASATRDDLGPNDPGAALALPCERLRAATAALAAEREAFVELHAL
jgi:hypothetical protein